MNRFRLIVALCLAALLGLAALNVSLWRLRREAARSEPAPVVRLVRTAATSTPQLDLNSQPAPAREPGFHWRQLESEDYPTYIRNLRAVGCPEPTIRNIILADVEELYAAKVRAVREPTETKFWKTGEQMTSEAVASRKEQQRLRREKNALTRELLGTDITLEGLREAREDGLSDVLAGELDLETGARFMSAWQHYKREIDEVRDLAEGIMIPEDYALQEQLFAQALAAFQQFVSPAKLNDFAALVNLFDGDSGLDFEQLLAVDLTGQELAHIAGLAGDAWHGLRKMLNLREQPNREETRKRSEEEMLVVLKGLLGEARYADYVAADDSGTRDALMFAKQFKLPRTVATSILDTRHAAEEQAATITGNAAMPLEQKKEMLKILRTQTENQLMGTLGPAAFGEFQKGSAGWLKNLEHVPAAKGAK